jgi:hypothetical protein
MGKALFTVWKNRPVINNHLAAAAYSWLPVSWLNLPVALLF